MRAISTVDWPQFVEDASLVDACLRAHEGYAAMDFLTRDRYRLRSSNGCYALTSHTLDWLMGEVSLC